MAAEGVREKQEERGKSCTRDFLDLKVDIRILHLVRAGPGNSVSCT